MKGGVGRWDRGMGEGEGRAGVSRGGTDTFRLPMGTGRVQGSLLEGGEWRRGAAQLLGGRKGDPGGHVRGTATEPQ